MIETYAYARAGLLGNPSDGYYGKTIALVVRNFRARVLLYPSARLEIKPSKADMPIFENLDDLYNTTRWRGYYGGIRIIQALIVRFLDYCRQHGDRTRQPQFHARIRDDHPAAPGHGGSSSIITAALRALCQYFDVEIPLPIQAKLILETETRELGVPAGPQDRVIQVYEGLVYMDFDRELMESQGYGRYEPMDPRLLPNLYLAYRTSLSEGTEVFHNNVRQRWLSRDAQVIQAMKTWAGYAEEGRQALLSGDETTLKRLIDANFDLRMTIYNISEGNLDLVNTARRVGATANFAGSGGAIVGTYEDEDMYRRLVEGMKAIGVGVVRPDILPRSGRKTLSPQIDRRN